MGCEGMNKNSVSKFTRRGKNIRYYHGSNKYLSSGKVELKICLRLRMLCSLES